VAIDYYKRIVLCLADDGTVEVNLKLSQEQIELAGATRQFKAGHEVPILKFDKASDQFSLLPFKLANTPVQQFLDPRHEQIEEIVLEGFELTNIDDEADIAMSILSLPTGFIKNLEYGVGLAVENRLIVQQVEQLTEATRLVISKTRNSSIDAQSDTYVLSFDDFEEIRKAIARITRRAREASRDVCTATTHNLLAPMLAKQDVQVRYRNNPMTRKFQDLLMEPDKLDSEDHDALVELVSTNVSSLAVENPKKIQVLHDEIQLATVDALILEFEDMLSKKLREDDWQQFFTENVFILTFAFGFPIVFVEGHASVGGKKYAGSGEKISDFLYKHEITGNVALFEIKTPQTALLSGSKPYRDGLYAPHFELTAAMNQVMDQRYQLEFSFPVKSLTSGRPDLRSYSINCCVIIGTLPKEEDKQKSFEFVRKNSRDVDVITFDELLRRLRHLSQFLSGSSSLSESASSEP